MKKGIVLLTGFLLAFSVFLAGCNGDQKESQEKKEQNDKFYQTGMNYENKLKTHILYYGMVQLIKYRTLILSVMIIDKKYLITSVT